MRKFLISTVLIFTTILDAPAAHYKVYLFAGQSNMAWGMYGNYAQEMLDWMSDSSNETMYHYWLSGTSSADWARLPDISDLNLRRGYEQVIGYRLWNYWQSIDSSNQVALIKVAQGSTGLYSFWNPGGRDRDPWTYQPDPAWFEQGAGYQALTNKIQTALSQLTAAGHTYSVEAMFWYQGEDDSYDQDLRSDNYPVLFEDLMNGWMERSGYPNDNESAYGGSIRELCGLTNLPVFVARISQNIKGSLYWGVRENWADNLGAVRTALVNYAVSHPQCNWIDVDDIPLADPYHYSHDNYAEIGERFAQICIETLYSDSAPVIEMFQPNSRAEYLPSENIQTYARAQDTNGWFSDSIIWNSSEEGDFASTETGVLTNSSWETRVTSIGSAAAPSNYVYTTSIVKRIRATFTTDSDHTMVKSRWVKLLADDDSDGLPDDWADTYWPGGNSGGGSNDADGDGFSNYQEWLAGTIPTDASSCLSVESLAFTEDTPLIQWQSQSNRTYQIRSTDSLMDGFTNTIDIVQTGRDAAQETVIDALEPSQSRFYRIELLR